MSKSARPGDAAAPLVEARGIAKTFAGHVALDETSFTIAKGEFLSLLGPSGSGKSTILNIISGMLSPTRGRVLIEGIDVTDVAPAKRGIGMVFQNYALMPHMTVFENIAFPLRIRRVPRQEIKRRVRDVLDIVRLPDIANRKPRELSGGQQQRVSLARCFVYNPSLILMDEPLGALDKHLREQMQLELKRLHSELAVTILYVTHDQEEAMSMSDRIILMNVGRIEQVGTPGQIYDHPDTIFAARFIGQSNLLPARIVSAGTDARAEIEGGLVVPVLGSGLAEGERGHILLRPEKLKLEPSGTTGGQRLAGELKDVLITGGVIHRHISCGDGRTLLVDTLNDGSASRFARGDSVSVSWSFPAQFLRDDAGPE